MTDARPDKLALIDVNREDDGRSPSVMCGYDAEGYRAAKNGEGDVRIAPAPIARVILDGTNGPKSYFLGQLWAAGYTRYQYANDTFAGDAPVFEIVPPEGASAGADE